MGKNFTLLSLLYLAAGTPAFCQEYSYRFKDQVVNLRAVPSKSIVQFSSEKTANDFFSTNKSLDSTRDMGLDGLYILYHSKLSVSDLKESNAKTQQLLSISPVLTNLEGKEIGGLSNQLIVKLKPATTSSAFQDILAKNELALDRKTEYDPSTFLISARSSNVDLFEVAERMYQTNSFDYVEPKFWLFVESATSNTNILMPPCTNDPYYSQQWGLNNTGQSGGVVDADMDVPEAWAITTGGSSVRIAIVDNGVERNHPDLAANITGGFDATSGTGCAANGILGNPNLCNGDSHGTTMAGIVAAVGCTATGVTGVAFTSKIVPVRCYQTQFITNNDWVASSIYYARNNAEIVNMSFTLAGSFSSVEAQINDAVTVGRGGKGTIFVAATGNNTQPVIGYPASHASVVAVGNTTRSDLRWYESQHGTGLDVVAPGTDIWTTDLTGSIGINTGNYGTITGTSGAAANVSGVFALMLSLNSNLTYTQARLLLESTTDKISTGTYSYANTAGQYHGTWNNQVGYGRANANKVLIAMQNSNITGPSTICTSGTFSLTVQPNVTRTWLSSNTSVLSINSTSGVATRVGSASGPVTITMRYSSSLASYEITKVIWVGTPDVSTIKYDNGISAGGSNYVSPNTSHTVYLDQQNVIRANVTNTNWNPNPNIGYGYGVGFSQFDFSLSPGSSISFNPVAATNSCGTVNRSLSFTANSSFMVAPNPATTELKIFFEDTKSEESLPTSIALVREATMETVKSITKDEMMKSNDFKSDKTYILNVSDLPRGVYYLRAKLDSTSNNETKTIRVVLQ